MLFQKEKEDKNQINRLDQKRERRSRRAFFLLSPISRKTLSGKVSLCTFLKKASLTLETAMALPLFFFGVLTLLSFMDIYKVQTEHLTGLCQKAKEAGMYAYGAGGSGTETITLPDIYSYQPIGGLIPLPKIWFHNTVKVHTWNGVIYENGKDTVESQPMVYVTESGSVYHRKLGCSYLNLSVQQISGCRTDKKLERDAVEFLSRKRVDGIISMPVDAEGNHLKKFQKTGKPIVLIDRRIRELFCDSVLVDNEKAAEDAMRVFFQAGHRKIGIIGGPEEISTAQERLQGYRNAYEKENIPVRESLIYHGDYTIQGGVQGIEKLVADNPDMTAVFVTNYEMTMGAVIGMNELGLKIPEQLSMIGFDNLQFARACNPKLTIVAQPTQGIAGEVAGIMLKRLEGAASEETEPITEKLGAEIIMGKSVRVLEEKENL